MWFKFFSVPLAASMAEMEGVERQQRRHRERECSEIRVSACDTDSIGSSGACVKRLAFVVAMTSRVILTAATPHLLILAGADTVNRVDSPSFRSRQLLPDVRTVARELTSWSNYRQTQILPSLFDEYNVSAWLLHATEYDEDPAFWAVWPAVGLRNSLFFLTPS